MNFVTVHGVSDSHGKYLCTVGEESEGGDLGPDPELISANFTGQALSNVHVSFISLFTKSRGVGSRILSILNRRLWNTEG